MQNKKENQTSPAKTPPTVNQTGDNLSEAIITTTASGAITYANKAATILLGINAKNAAGAAFTPPPGVQIQSEQLNPETTLHILRPIPPKPESPPAQQQTSAGINKELTEIFTSGIDENTGYSQAMETIIQATNTEYGLIGYLDENNNLITASITNEIWKGCDIAPSNTVMHRADMPGILNRAVDNQKPVFTNEPSPVPDGHAPIRNAIAAPVQCCGNIIGVIMVANKPSPFTEDDAALFSSITTHLAPIISFKRNKTLQEQEIRRIEKEVEQNTRISQLLLDSLPHPAMLIDKNRIVIAANRIANETGAIVSQTCWASFHHSEFIPDEYKPSSQSAPPEPCGGNEIMCRFCLADQALENNEPIRIELEKAGEIWDTWWVPVNENIYLHYAINITEHKQNERQLDLYRDRLEELVRQRTTQLEKAMDMLVANERLAALGQFAGGMAHEIRNPLGVIGTSVYILKRRLLNEDSRVLYHIDRIKEQVDNCANIIESILRLTRMESPKLEALNAAQHIRAVANSLRIPPSILINMDLPEEPIIVHADKEQLRIAFKNIITNAIQAMPDGGIITIDLKLTPVAQEKPTATIVFSDNGPGISTSSIDKILQPLYTTKATGIGFGLSIVKQIIDKHLGELNVESTPGHGATFTIILPLA